MAHLSATTSAVTPSALRSTHISSRRPRARAVIAPHASKSNNGMGDYLSKAAAQIFSPINRGVNWTTTPFTGQIDHHENAKHGHFAPDVKTRQHEQKALFTSDPRVQHRTSGADETTPEVNGFVAGLRSLFNGNFSNSTAYGKNEPKSFGGHTGFPDDIARNQREISRLLSLTKDDSMKPPRM
eukprot:CAMPEP_0177774708 /NCGR_PEP_ID=MMETSP0491_2-20121128/13678_1 /TAXON_ID=63592 /ORGANISM="Tetraselmis chuii, Strain PLY429" /LENGTH=182 /DNA_ID=CAMNT_0019293159 /DNA_START=196 /DNA_END=744 /DNA_ORIENTATION=+